MTPHPVEDVTLASLAAAHGPALARFAGTDPDTVTAELLTATLFEVIDALESEGSREEAESLEDVLALLTSAQEQPGTDLARHLLADAGRTLHTVLPAILATARPAATR
ncbi:hypothetical protein [Kitasatospora sp. NPDC088134]|uniref:hypothetical protein n=1 Tax=Kitasatospora sp. NPDC088134 TaxID=3364071 RepID=UPI0037FEAAC3